jgi:hypothetical protein
MAKQPSSVSHELLSRIAEAIQGIRFGSVQITIHDSQVVQIEKAEKIRVPEAGLTPGGCELSTGPTNRMTGGSPTGNGR